METSIDAVSICRIIRESAKCGVTKLQIGDLKIDFSSQLGSESKLEPPKTQNFIPLPGQAETIAKHDELETPRLHLTDEQREAFEEFEEAQQMIEDPLGFEERIVDLDIEAQRVRGNDEARPGGTE
jgi:hypothetical protein